MSWIIVAKKDFHDALRSRVLIILTTLFVLFSAGHSYFFYNLPQIFGAQDSGISTVSLLGSMRSSISLLIPLIALVIGYKAVVGERDSGSIKLLLSLPNTRRDVIIGKLLGRMTVVTLSIIVGFIAEGVVGTVIYDSFAIFDLFAFSIATVIFAFVFVAIAVGFSAMMQSSSRAFYGALGSFIIFEFVWKFVPTFALYVINGFSFPNITQSPNWAIFFSSLNPQVAYDRAVAALLPDLATTSANNIPFYLHNWFAFLILGIWFVIPITIGYCRFRRMDL
jgi:ABC-2 type transport system permease protein